ncbi:MAG: molybdenum cofactor biosynthesis protein MoaE [Magnetococcales bacterium]|nr:molybdenum cofactor biosynthesis protein MoaE [Magnetococcales bacterium]
MIRVQRENFSVEDELKQATQGGAALGGIALFVGTVRESTPGDGGDTVAAIELEHYPGMTERELAQVEADALRRFPVDVVHVVHRIGRLEVGENIVLVITASSHRAEAFEACRYVIDHLKIRATFWKKEFLVDGTERWVDICPGCEAAACHWDDLKGLAHTHPVEPKSHHPQDHGKHLGHRHHGHHKDHGHIHNHKTVDWNGLRVGLLTLSDSRSLSQDTSGDALAKMIAGFGGDLVNREILPDDQGQIEQCLVNWADSDHLNLILTTGGTGPGPRDITPEATKAVCDKVLPGVAEEIRRQGLKQVRSAVLTRGVAAVRGETLVVNLPGSRRGSTFSLAAVADLVPHIVRMVKGGGH